MILARHEIGEVLRGMRVRRGYTLRKVAGKASVALGYLSEVERGQKEASSEILAAVAEALDVPLSEVYREVSDRLAVRELKAPRLAAPEGVVPDTVPDELVRSINAAVAHR